MADRALKLAARSAANVAVRRGDLPRPNDLPCVDCGHVVADDGKRHEYDHHRGYERAMWLDVQAVCVPCHKKRDSPKVAQTECVHGHAYTIENTGRKKNGTRFCRQCRSRFNRMPRTRPPDYWRKINAKRAHKNYGRKP
jgi:hypothetical protein